MPTNVFLDFETRSPVDLLKAGHYRYAEDPATEVQCLAFRVGTGPTRLWYPSRIREKYALESASETEVVAVLRAMPAATYHAHNAGFERAILFRCLGIEIPAHRWRCTAAKAAALGLPRHLGQLTEALALSVRKNEAGARLMRAMCKPDKRGNYRESAEDYRGLGAYCMQDVEAEMAVDVALPDLSPALQALWVLDQRINDRGVCVDVESAQAIADALAEYSRALGEEIPELTSESLESVRQVGAALEWLAAENCAVPNLQKETVLELLARGDTLTPAVRRFLEIRAELAKSSVTKYRAFLRMASPADRRVRGALLFHGAATGRWSGSGYQPHNLPRFTVKRDKKPITAEVAFAFRELGLAAVESAGYGGNPFAAASGCLRHMIRAPEGRAFLCADFANIEGRVAAWIAGESWKLEAFRALDAGTGEDLYRLSYARSFGVPVASVGDAERQIGKVQELALQYQGWSGAFEAMAKGYGVRLPEEQVVDVCKGWREAHPAIVGFWGNLERGAILAVQNPGQAVAVGPLALCVRTLPNGAPCLLLRLPSGRMLSYYRPRVTKADRHGRTVDRLVYWGVDSYTKRWGELHTYGGCLFENAVQGTACCILSAAMHRAEFAGFEIVLHVHDEILAEIAASEPLNALDVFCRTMSEPPPWAEGCPIAAKGWRGDRYRKD